MTALHAASRAFYYGAALEAEDAARNRLGMWKRFLVEPHRLTYVVDTGTDLAGFIHFLVPPDESSPVELIGLYVSPNMVGSGIGSALYLHFARSLQTREAVLEVWQGNSRAQRFYETRGWVPTDRFRAGPNHQPFVTWSLSRGAGFRSEQA